MRSKLLYPSYYLATFGRGPDKKKRKSRKGLLIGAGLVGGAALLAGGLLLRNKVRPMTKQQGILTPKKVLETPSLTPSSVTKNKSQLTENITKPISSGYSDQSVNERILDKLLPPQPKQSSQLALTRKQQNTAIVQTRKKLYGDELVGVKQAKLSKQDLDSNPGKYKSKRRARYKSIRKRRENLTDSIRQTYDQI